MKKIAILAGARPNYMKIAPILRALDAYKNRVECSLIHTGQHYDKIMNDVFFRELEISIPDHFLNVGSGTHAVQTANIMTALEPVLQKEQPDILVVVGDVNSTMAGAITAKKLHTQVAHVEAGLRSFDRTMPEEINRLVTDAVSDLFFTTCADGDNNLIREGIAPSNIFMVGNTMIDTLVRMIPKAGKSEILTHLGVEEKSYIAVTLHRPANVDDPDSLRRILETLGDLASTIPVIFPVHPRTQARIRDLKAGAKSPATLKMIDPLGYIDFLRLTSCTALMITDSGGIQEETTFLGIPCLTLRPNTERPITITEGTNRLVSLDNDDLGALVKEILNDQRQATRSEIKFWDGKAGERIARCLSD